MVANGLLDKARVEIKYGTYGVAPATALSDPSILPIVQDYRRQAGARMYPLDPDDIHRKIPSSEYHVSLKLDGEFTVLVYQEGSLFTINPGGTVRVGMPWQEEALKCLKNAGIKQVMIAGELYAANDQNRRERVHDVTSLARQPKNKDDLSRLRFAVFDYVSVNGAPANGSFPERWQSIQKTFAESKLIHPVKFQIAKNSKEIDRFYKDWVLENGAEGLVVRSDSVGTFKIKPRHSLDAAVIGFTESADDRQGMMHDLLLAIGRTDGALQVLCRVGGGFSEDARRELLSDLKDMVVASEYAEVNSDHVAYQMVAPKWVVEINFLDLISQTTRGGPVNRMVLNWNRNASMYEVVRRLPLCSVISPQFVRLREDKSVNKSDVRINQVSELVEVPLADRDARRMTLPKSTPLRREVYTKILKGEKMVRKFLMWKTNKEKESDEFPGFVIHYSDFSPNRKTPLNRDIRVSNSHAQIIGHWVQLKEDNIKKGWEPVSVESNDDSAKMVLAGSQPETEPSVKKSPSKPTTGKSSVKPARKSTSKKKPAAAKKLTGAKTTKTKSTARKKQQTKKTTSARKSSKTAVRKSTKKKA